MKKITLFQMFIFLTISGISLGQEKTISLFSGFTADSKQKNQDYIFYNAKNNQFVNFVLSCDIQTEPGGVAEILFHTENNAGKGIPKGYAVRIKNTYDGYGSGDKLRLTGSIDRIRNIYFPYVKDNEWFALKIDVENKRIRVFINNKLISEYYEIENTWRPDDLKNRILSKGTIGIHSIDGKVTFKNVNLTEKPSRNSVIPDFDWNYDKLITSLHAKNFPLIDFHVHIKGGLTMDEALAISREKGINCGIAANCGLHFPVTNNRELNEYMNSIQNEPIFRCMQAEGREWMTLFSPDTAARFDYIFTDAMTWTNSNGKRLRLWIKEETEVGDPEKFMDELVGKIEQILQEPIDIYVNSTFIPEEIQPRYNELWTEERMDRVIQALVKNNVAFEINSRYKIPTIAFIKKAKAAGVKFTFGTNNTGRDDLDYTYCFKVLNEVGLTPADMWMPSIGRERKIHKVKK
jgi:hypothetical protein